MPCDTLPWDLFNHAPLKPPRTKCNNRNPAGNDSKDMVDRRLIRAIEQATEIVSNKQASLATSVDAETLLDFCIVF